MDQERGRAKPADTGEDEPLLPNFRPRHSDLIPTPCGQIKSWYELSGSVRFYFIFSILSALVVFSLTIYSISLQKLTDTTISLIQLIGTVFCCYYVMRGIFQENRQELMAFALSVCLVMVRSVVNFAVASGGERTLELKIRFSFILIVGVFHIAFALWLMCGPNMMAFRVSGASESSQSQYSMQNLCFSLVTFDLQAQLCLCVLFLTAGVGHISKVHSTILWVGICWAIAKAPIGLTAILKGKKALIWFFMILNVPDLVYLGYLLYEVISKWDCKGSCVLEAGTVTGTVISVFIKVGLFWSVIKVVRSFGHELRGTLFTSPMG